MSALAWTAASGRGYARSTRTPQGEVLRWDLRANCSLTPRQTALGFATVCVLPALTAGGFWLAGFPVIALFTGLELLAVAVALLVYARHACDRETLTLVQGRLQVEQHVGREVRRTVFEAAWLRVEPGEGPQPLLLLRERERCLAIGRHLTLPQRERVRLELRRALMGAGVAV